MSRHGFLRWFGWSAAAHLALGAALWIGLPKADPTNLPASDAAVTLVTLVNTPAPEHPTTQPLVSSAPPPLEKGGGGDLLLGPKSHPPMDIVDESVVNHRSDSSLFTSDTAQPDSPVEQINDLPDPQDGATSALPPSPASLDVSEPSPNAGAPTDAYRPLVLAMLERAKRYPLVADRWRLEGTVDIEFTIHPDGRLSDPALIASSTHPILDEAALAIVRRVRHVPPPPSQAPIRFSALIRYQVDQ
ncbi:MAG: energy transducer TonB [Nitrospirota bacterium]